jgi:eukaryotic-like serine/threonine-protein kinase
MNHSTDERGSSADLTERTGPDPVSRCAPEGSQRTTDIDSVLLGLREASRGELVERICVDQVRRWRAGQQVPAESYLFRYPSLRDDEALFELIYGEYVLREERGATPSVEELSWRFPGFADRLCRQVELHKVFDAADVADTPHSTGRASSSEPDDAPELEGPFVAPGFRILGELGRGGMGTVYKAWQVRLKRIVALKVLHAGSYADSSAVERFQAEAEAAARIQHANIVQIYEIGEHEGMGYLVLEYAAGGGLDRRLLETVQDPRESARLIETLARAIHFAHERNIIHRDLKPANVLLTEDGVPKIADFGLAKLLERDDALTRHGEIVGTPSYMAPEQVCGLAGDIAPTTDVYSLGAILYETLTGRPPFKGTTPLSTLEQVASQEPLPPGKIQHNIPRDLETICLKCLAKDPGRRYPSALALAEDLERFVHGRPILARPIPFWARVWKWARRRPGSAAAAVGLLTLSALLLGEGLYYNHRLHKEMLAARRAELQAAADAEIAKEQRNLALKALNQLIYDVQEKLAQTPATRSLRRSLLDTAIRGLEELGRSSEGASPDISQAVAYQKLGEIFRVIGQSSSARNHFERSQRIAELLLADASDSLAVREVLYQDYMGLGLVDIRSNRFDDAKLGLRHAVATAESIAATKATDRSARRDLIEAYLQLGRAYSFAREYHAAEPWFRKMHDLALRWVDEDPHENQARDLLASALRKLADLRKLTDKLPEARAAYIRAIEIGRELVEKEPSSDAFRSHLATALDDLGVVAKRQHRPGEARDLFGQAEAIFAALLAEDPDNLDWRIQVLSTRHHLALLDHDESRFAEARAALIRIRDELRTLARDGRLEGRQADFITDEHKLDALIEGLSKSLRTSG